jgi:hypothetical protein
VKEVHLLGRRGPVQAAFTPKELRELLGLKGVKVRARQGKVGGHRPLLNRRPSDWECLDGLLVPRVVIHLPIGLVQLFWVLIQCV